MPVVYVSSQEALFQSVSQSVGFMELELELIQSQMAQKPMLRGEVAFFLNSLQKIDPAGGPFDSTLYTLYIEYIELSLRVPKRALACGSLSLKVQPHYHLLHTPILLSRGPEQSR